jgi:hypothetical protein
MKRFALLFFAPAALLVGQASGTNGRFAGPTLGFVQGSAPSELQPILGIPGAARLGDPMLLPDSVTQTYLAPGHSYALAAQGSSAPLAVVLLRGSSGIAPNPTLVPIPGAMAHADLVAFSPTAAAAALYSQQSGEVQVFTALPNSPHLLRDISNVQIAGAAHALAVSDDAQSVLIADASGTVYALSANAAPAPVYHVSQVSALVFVSQSHDAIVCDPASGSAAIVSADGAVQTLQPPSGNGCRPQAAASTTDGRTILMACPAEHLIWSVDRASGATSTYKVTTSPTALDNVGARDAFLISPADDGGTHWLLTWRPDGPVISFIGAPRRATQGAGH